LYTDFVSDEAREAVAGKSYAGQRALLGAGAAVLVVAGLKVAEPLLVPIVFALFLGILVQPLQRSLLRRGAPVPVAVLVAILVLAAVAAVFILLLLGSLGELRAAGPAYYAEFQDRISYTVEWWQEKGIAILDWVPARYREPQAIGEAAGGAVKGIVALASQLSIILLTLIFMLVEAAELPAKLDRLPPRYREALLRVTPVSRELQRYLQIKTAMSIAIGLTAGAWVALLGIDFAVLCGMIAFACHFVPNVGALIAAVPPMLLAFVQFDLAKSLTVFLGYLVIGMVLGNILEPALLGRRLGMSTLVVWLSLLFWGWLWGPVGMLLSVPLTGVVKILLERSAAYRWLAVLLDAGSPRLVPPAEPTPESAASDRA
jgi:predicted PurR-regulated permease PerM